jgi:hypothetical protein
MTSASMRHYTIGVSAIKGALVQELVRQKIPGADVTTRGGPTGPHVPGTIYTVTAKGRTEEETFTYDDIKDSAKGKVEEHVFYKIQGLVSRFIPT